MGDIASIDDLTAFLRGLRHRAGDTSYSELVRRVNAARDETGHKVGRTTIYECFQSGRKQIDMDLVLDIADALGLDGAGTSRLKRAIEALLNDAESSSVADVRDSVPAVTERFTGRTAPLRDIAAELRRCVDTGSAPVVTVTGPAGVGKTELALNAVHRLLSRGRCQDARLFADLHGFVLERPPTSPDAVLVGLLTLLGVGDERIHACRSLDAKTELFRRTMDGKKAVLVLDNAAGPRQVEPLLPDSTSCVVVVTSRQRFDNDITLDALAADEAIDMLRRHDPHGRIDADPATARRIAVDLCGGIPLDLSVVGAQLADPDEADWTLDDHAMRLERFPRDEASRPALAASYEKLSRGTQSVFRLLSLHPGTDFTAYDTAALADATLVEAEKALQQLYERHLLFQRLPARYQFHDAVHSFAHRLCHQRDPASRQVAAVNNLLHLQRFTATQAMDHYAPYTKAHRPKTPPLEVPTPAITDETDATAWLEAEHNNLVRSAIHAIDVDSIAHTCYMSATLATYLSVSGKWHAAASLHAEASRCSPTEDKSRVLNSLANIYTKLGRAEEAHETLEQSLALADETGNRLAQGAASTNLGNLCRIQGRYDEASAYLRRALDIFRAIGNKYGECTTVLNLGTVLVMSHHVTEAIACYQQALDLARDIGNRFGEANAHYNLGDTLFDMGAHGDGLRHLGESVAIAREIGNREIECVGLNRIAKTWHDLNKPEHAIGYYRNALDIACEVGDCGEQARAHRGIAGLLAERGEIPEARTHWQQALDLFSEMGVPEADEVAKRLAEIDRSAPASR